MDPRNSTMTRYTNLSRLKILNSYPTGILSDPGWTHLDHSNHTASVLAVPSDENILSPVFATPVFIIYISTQYYLFKSFPWPSYAKLHPNSSLQWPQVYYLDLFSLWDLLWPQSILFGYWWSISLLSLEWCNSRKRKYEDSLVYYFPSSAKQGTWEVAQ